MTLNAREVDLVLGLLTRNAHVHLSRFSTISGTDFAGLLDDAIESILEPTETVTARNTGATTTTNDTSSVTVTGAASSLSASQSGTAIQSRAFVAYCSNNTELQNVFVPQPPQSLVVQSLVMAVDADGNEIGQRCDQSIQGQWEPPPVSLQEQQVTSSDSLQGQSAIPPVPVPGQQVDSDGEAMAFFAAEPFVIDQEHDERVWATLDEGCNAACHSASWAARAERYFDMFGFHSEYREDTRTKVFTGLGGNTVAAIGRRKRASFFKGTLEQARLAGLTDEEIASIAAAFTPVLEKEERSGGTGRSVKRGVLPEACSSQTTKRGKAVLEPPSNPERVPPEEHAAYSARHFEHHDQLMQAGSTSTPATTTTPSTDATTAATTQAAVTIAGTRILPAPPPATQSWGTGRHPRTADREETLRVLMRKTKISRLTRKTCPGVSFHSIPDQGHPTPRRWKRLRSPFLRRRGGEVGVPRNLFLRLGVG